MTTREEIIAAEKECGMAGMITDVVTTLEDLERFATHFFEAGAASRDAEVQRLQMALADTEALELGTAEKCDQLRAEVESLKESLRLACEIREGTSIGEQRLLYWEQLQSKLAATETELEAARAEIERLQAESDPEALHIAYLHGQADRNQNLAAEQAKNVQLREAAHNVVLANNFTEARQAILILNTNLQKLPCDTSSLEAIVNKAGEVMRERCAVKADWFTPFVGKKIRALPAVTLEDLK